MLRERLGKEMLLFDGAMGSMLQQARPCRLVLFQRNLILMIRH